MKKQILARLCALVAAAAAGGTAFARHLPRCTRYDPDTADAPSTWRVL